MKETNCVTAGIVMKMEVNVSDCFLVLAHQFVPDKEAIKWLLFQLKSSVV